MMLYLSSPRLSSAMYQHVSVCFHLLLLLLVLHPRFSTGSTISETSLSRALNKREPYQGGTSLSVVKCCPAGTNKCPRSSGTTCCPNGSQCDWLGESCCPGNTDQCEQVKSLQQCADAPNGSWKFAYLSHANICCPSGWDPTTGQGLGNPAFCKPGSNAMDTCASNQPVSDPTIVIPNNSVNNDQPLRLPPSPAPPPPAPAQPPSSLATALIQPPNQFPHSSPISSEQRSITSSASRSSLAPGTSSPSSPSTRITTGFPKDDISQGSKISSAGSTASTDASPRKYQPGEVAGITIGSLFGTGLLVAICVIAFSRWKRTIYEKARVEAAANFGHKSSLDNNPPNFWVSEIDGSRLNPLELDGRRFRTPEMDASPQRRELE